MIIPTSDGCPEASVCEVTYQRCLDKRKDLVRTQAKIIPARGWVHMHGEDILMTEILNSSVLSRMLSKEGVLPSLRLRKLAIPVSQSLFSFNHQIHQVLVGHRAFFWVEASWGREKEESKKRAPFRAK